MFVAVVNFEHVKINLGEKLLIARPGRIWLGENTLAADEQIGIVYLFTLHVRQL